MLASRERRRAAPLARPGKGVMVVGGASGIGGGGAPAPRPPSPRPPVSLEHHPGRPGRKFSPAPPRPARDMLIGLGLLVGERGADIGEPAHDTLVHRERPAQQGADACADLRIERARIAACDLDSGELAWTTCGQMLTPNAGKLHTLRVSDAVLVLNRAPFLPRLWPGCTVRIGRGPRCSLLVHAYKGPIT